MKKALLLPILIALIFVAFAVGYYLSPKPQPAVLELPKPVEPVSTPITFIDSLGRYVTFEKVPTKIVVLYSYAAEVMRVLGVEDKIIGISDSIAEDPLWWGDIAKKPIAGSMFRPSYEKIAALMPDVVILYERWPGPEAEEKIAPLGIKVVRIGLYRLETLASDIRALGLMFGKTKEADEYIRFYEEPLKVIKERMEKIKPEKRVRVYFESIDDWATHAPGSGGHEMVIAAGGINIAADQPVPHPRVSPEWVVERNPEVIIKWVSKMITPHGYGVTDVEPMKKLREEIMGRPGLKATKAVETGRVYLLGVDIKGPRMVVGIYHIAKWLYPDLFADLNPEALHKEIVERFHKLEFKGGVFVYP